jgi:hypothetical protein
LGEAANFFDDEFLVGGARLVYIYANYARMGVRRTHEHRVKRAIGAMIVAVAALAAQERPVLVPALPLSHGAIKHGVLPLLTCLVQLVVDQRITEPPSHTTVWPVTKSLSVEHR